MFRFKFFFHYFSFIVIVVVSYVYTATNSNTSTKIVDILNNSCNFGYYYDGNNCTDCGITYTEPNVRIVGGIEALKGSFPAQVLIVQNVYIAELRSQFRMQCGGTLINQYTVLSAAHCITSEIRSGQILYKVILNNRFPTLESMFKIYIGAFDISFVKNNLSPPNDVLVSNVVKIIQHESYNDATMANDIALFILDKKVYPGLTVNIACLPPQSDYFPGFNVTSYAAGWGATTEGGSSPDVLYNVKLTIYNPNFCSFVKLSKFQICAGELNGGKDTCQGDSGSGLYIRQSINGSTKFKHIVAGIVSFGVGCGMKNYPGIYTRTSYYVDWISLKLNGLKIYVKSNSTINTSPKITSNILGVISILGLFYFKYFSFILVNVVVI